MLLGDWVFTQQPLTVARLTEVVVGQPGFKVLLANIFKERGSTQLISPERCGRTELIRACVEVLAAAESSDIMIAISHSFRQVLSESEIQAVWLSLKDRLDPKRWLYLGRLLGSLAAAQPSYLNLLLDNYGPRLITELILSNRIDFIESCSENFSEAVEIALSGKGYLSLVGGPGNDPTPYSVLFGSTLDIDTYSAVFNRNSGYFSRAVIHGLPFQEVLSARRYGRQLETPTSETLRGTISDDLLDRCDRFLAAHRRVVGLSTVVWGNSLEPWSELVEAGIREFGFKPIFFDLALLSARINSKTEPGAIGDGLHDPDVPLCERIRYARLRPNATNWWSSQLSCAVTEDDWFLAVTVLLVWATPKVILALADEIALRLEKLGHPQWDQLFGRLERASKTEKANVDELLFEGLAKCKPRLRVAVVLRHAGEAAASLVSATFRTYRGNDRNILKVCLNVRGMEAARVASKWRAFLPLIRHSYQQDVTGFMSFSASDAIEMPTAVAEEICANSLEYPLTLVEAAQSLLTKTAGLKARAPGAVARLDQWFQ